MIVSTGVHAKMEAIIASLAKRNLLKETSYKLRVSKKLGRGLFMLNSGWETDHVLVVLFIVEFDLLIVSSISFSREFILEFK